MAELEERLGLAESDLAEPLNADNSEQALGMQDEAALDDQIALIRRAIASVGRALDRIAQGTYGECERCSGAITPG